MDFLKDCALVGLGYVASSFVNDRKEKKKYDSISYDNLEDLIVDYAHRHDIYGRDQNFYNAIMRVAEQFRDPYA
jgi:hypothetical protein